MMLLKSAIFAQWFMAAVIGGWAWFFAQATTLDTVERLLGGAGIAAVSVVAVTITLRASANQRNSWTETLNFERLAAQTARDERDVACRERDEYRKKYDEERTLRMSLEEQGIVNRRHTIEDKENR